MYLSDSTIDIATDITVSEDLPLRYDIACDDESACFTLGDGCHVNLTLHRDCLPRWIATLTEAKDELAAADAAAS